MYGSMLTNALPDVKKQDIAADVQALRASFATGATKDLATRRSLLQQLNKMVKEGEPLLQEALWKDLHKNPVESYMSEIALVYQEIQDHLDHLEDWASPERVSTSIPNLPGFSYINRDPFGVCCIIGTWNYPVNLLLMPLVSCLAAGNCALLRLPGDDTAMHTNNALIMLLDKYMDKRYVRYVYVGVPETKEMLSHQFDLIFATGGCFLGKIVARAAAEFLTPVVLELGGKSPTIVDDTADLEIAARRITWGAFTNAGQTCVRPDYLLVDEKIGDQLVKLIEKNIVKFFGEDAQKSDSYGRVINRRSFDRLAKLLVNDKARITFGGKTDEKEHYVEPTLLNFKTDFAAFKGSAVMSDELFGPVLPIYYYNSGNLTSAIEFINERPKPLALYLYSTRSEHKRRVAKETSSGSMVINDCMMQLANAHLPFGGVGNSGMGAYHGKHSFDTFSHKKAVLYKYSALDLQQRYQPYTAAGERVMRVVLYPFSRRFWNSLKFVGFAIVVAAIAIAIKQSTRRH
ncbi:TPA: hypothetical protein N0F65_002469 [Lagenidium giganteum]|uniref:Aldehyde dehydrogenase n=1 Tax=Lagenidium giganteum TaxID=4803 RepID=A0AAV2YM33_9STRA|nr:TPA: hypothetical protein N0F65_002469 [Lagenidium giganteum]